LREQYDEAVQALRERHGSVLADLERQRSEALARLTEADRKLRELSPYRAVRARYDEMSSVELIPAIRDRDPIPARYERAKEAMEASLLQADGSGAGGSDRSELEDVRLRYDAALRLWSEGGRTETVAHEINERRSEYERSLAQLEIALLVKGPVAGNGELVSWREAYQDAEQAYVEIERRHDAERAPFDEGLRDAEREHEKQRVQYVSAVEEIREELQKAPQQYEDRFKEILARFQEQCAGEREQVVEAGGVHILGTERHEARRIDNQLRGRAGRQGDPGSSRFYLSLEDDLLRIFGADRMQNMMQKLGMEDGVPIEHRFVTRAIRNAQEKVEAHNFDMRKHLLEYDDVLNKQREVVYARRRELPSREGRGEEVREMAEGLATDLVASHVSDEVAPDEWDLKTLDDAVFAQFNLRLNLPEAAAGMTREAEVEELVVGRGRQTYAGGETNFTAPVMRHLERIIWLQTLDTLWRARLLSMDHLKEGIGLRGYGQKNPLQEYQKEGYDLFEELIRRMEADVIEKLMSVQLQAQSMPVQPGADEETDTYEPPLPAAITDLQRRPQRAPHA